jgi:hypothetical protein
VEKRLLLDGITLHAGDVAPRHLQHTVNVAADLADARRTGRNRAIVSAGMAANPVPVETFVDISGTGARAQELAESPHLSILPVAVNPAGFPS